MRFPKISEVAYDLRAVNDDCEDECDVRLQVYPDGNWSLHFGDASYDQDHRGYWGASSVPGGGRRFNSTEMARDLIDQAREQRATSGDDDAD